MCIKFIFTICKFLEGQLGWYQKTLSMLSKQNIHNFVNCEYIYEYIFHKITLSSSDFVISVSCFLDAKQLPLTQSLRICASAGCMLF